MNLTRFSTYSFEKYAQMNFRLHEVITLGNTQHDLKWFSKNLGVRQIYHLNQIEFGYILAEKTISRKTISYV